MVTEASILVAELVAEEAAAADKWQMHILEKINNYRFQGPRALKKLPT